MRTGKNLKRVLIVDDERPFLASVRDGLARYNSLVVVTAVNGVAASLVLASEPVDLVVTDLRMPEMDGFALLSHMSAHYPGTPVVVMTAYDTETIDGRAREAGALRCLQKPLDLDELASVIFELLTAGEHGFIEGISVPAFLQLLEMEGKTAQLRISSSLSSGLLCLEGGRLVDARVGDKRGDAAASDIIAWESAVIHIEDVKGPVERTVTSSLGFLVMESARLRDERDRNGALPATAAEPDLEFAEWDDFPAPEKEASSFLDGNSTGVDLTRGQAILEAVMGLEGHLKQLRDVKGYKASAIMNFTGEVLVSDTADDAVDLNIVGATFNDIFRSAHEASEKIGLEACRETVINTPKGTVVMQCSGVHAKAHIHVIGVIEKDGNQALMRMKFDQAVPRIVNEL